MTTTIESPLDDRDYIFEAFITEFPPSLDLKPSVFEIDNQYSVGSCVSNALTSSCELLLNKDNKSRSLSRLFNYWTARNLIQQTTSASGTNIRSALKAAYTYGIPDETSWAYDTSKEAVKPDEAVFTLAESHKITRYEKVFFGIKGAKFIDETLPLIKSALNEGLPVVIAMRIGVDFQTLGNDWKTQQYSPVNLNKKNPSIGNHAMLVIGYDDECGKLLLENSWGKEWGDGGFCGIPYDVAAKDMFEGWVVRSFDGSEVVKPTKKEDIKPVPIPTPVPVVKPTAQEEKKDNTPIIVAVVVSLLIVAKYFGLF